MTLFVLMKSYHSTFPITELVSSWKHRRLGGWFHSSRSYPEYYNGTIPWLKTGDLNDGYITNIPESISEEALKILP